MLKRDEDLRQALKTQLQAVFPDLADVGRVANYFEPAAVRKSEILVEPNKTCQQLYFLTAGCLRSYYRRADGQEITYNFYREGDFVTILDSFMGGGPSQYGIQALDSGKLLCLSKEALDSLRAQYPPLQSIMFSLLSEHSRQVVKRTQLQQISSSKERIGSFLQLYPYAMRYAKQKDMASFLGMTKETFSRLL